MSLSCGCDSDWYPEAGDTYIVAELPFAPMKFRSYRARCCSCKQFINSGDTVLEFERVKCPADDVELAIFGEEGEIPRASLFMCETCSDIYLSLEEIGYCPQINKNQHDLLDEHHAMKEAMNDEHSTS